MGTMHFGQIGRLKRDRIAEYRALHAAAWPGVLKTIADCHLRNYNIYLKDDTVFSSFEYTGGDFGADMEKMARDPVTQAWWTHTKPCFERFAYPPDEFYSDMECIFHFE